MHQSGLTLHLAHFIRRTAKTPNRLLFLPGADIIGHRSVFAVSVLERLGNSVQKITLRAMSIAFEMIVNYYLSSHVTLTPQNKWGNRF